MRLRIRGEDVAQAAGLLIVPVVLWRVRRRRNATAATLRSRSEDGSGTALTSSIVPNISPDRRPSRRSPE